MADQKIAPSTQEVNHSKEEKEISSPTHLEGDDDDVGKDHMNFDRIDKEVAKYASDVAIHISPEENRRLKRLVDKRIVVVMIFTYFIQALDKGTLSFASIMGIQKDAHLHGAQYAWLNTAIYIAILIVEYPTNWLLARLPVAKYLGVSIILWGTVLMLHSVAKSFIHLLVLRILLGIFECVCQPAFVLLSSMWYKREEQAATISYWYMMNGGQQIVGGLLAYCFTLIQSPPSPIKNWQAIFLAYGSFSVCWGAFVLWWMPDSPMRAKCFTEEDKKLMIERVRSNQTGMQNRRFRKEQFLEALRDPQMYCHCLIAICTTLPTSGLGSFFQIVVKGLLFTTLQTQLLAMVLGSYLIVVLLSSMYFANKYKQNLIIMIIYVIP
jgi:MFS family permease